MPRPFDGNPIAVHILGGVVLVTFAVAYAGFFLWRQYERIQEIRQRRRGNTTDRPKR